MFAKPRVSIPIGVVVICLGLCSLPIGAGNAVHSAAASQGLRSEDPPLAEPEKGGREHPPAEENAGETNGPAELQKPVARVGDELIRLEDTMHWLRTHPQEYSVFGAQWERKRVLNQMIKQLLLEAAATEAFADDPKAKELSVQAKIARYRERFLTPPEPTSGEELRAHYNDNRARFGIPPMVRIRELFFPKPPRGASDEQRERAWAVYSQLKAGRNFADFVQEYAPDYPARLAGGDRGFLSVVERPQLGALTKDMSPGDISEPFELTTGFSIVQYLDRRSAVPASFEAVEDEVKRHWLAERAFALESDFYSREGRRRGVEILSPDFAGAWPQPNASPGTGASDIAIQGGGQP